MSRCIFCKSESSSSKSVEHIVPQSLGNTDHVLPPGIVCDKCNNYFARKVERPLLESEFFSQLRSRQWIPNKRGRVPPLTAVLPQMPAAIDLWIDGLSMFMEPRDPTPNAPIVSAIRSGQVNKLIYPHARTTDQSLVSRLLAKIAVEVLAQRLMGKEGWEYELYENPQLDPIRRYARLGDKSNSWPINERILHHEYAVKIVEGEVSQILHEYTLLYTSANELYFVIAIFGREYAINFGGPDIDGYLQWLREHSFTSPLYLDDDLPRSPLGRGSRLHR